MKKNKLNTNRNDEKKRTQTEEKTLVERNFEGKSVRPKKNTLTHKNKKRNSNYTSTWSAVFENP